MDRINRIPTVVIIMALQREEDALLIARDRIRSLNDEQLDGGTLSEAELITPPLSPIRYEQFYAMKKGKIRKLRIVTVTLTEMGPLAAAAVTGHAIHDWHPDVIFLAGICAGIPDKTAVRLGDLIIASRVIDRDSGKYISGRMQRSYPSLTCDPNVYQGLRRFAGRFSAKHTISTLSDKFQSVEKAAPSHGIRGFKRVRYPAELMSSWLSRDDPILSEILSREPSLPPCYHDIVAAHEGILLSGATVVKSISLREDFIKEMAAAKGIEMEGAGIAAVLSRFADHPRLAIVKGICDFADEVKDDRWQSFSAAASATFILEYLLQLTDAEIAELPRSPMASDILRFRVPWHYKREGLLDGWQARLVDEVAGICKSECDAVMDGDYKIDLTQAHQYVLRAQSLFAPSDESSQVFVTAVERVSKFWFHDGNSSEVASFINCQPKTTVRIFVLQESKKRNEKQISTIVELLDQHRQQYDSVYITTEAQYAKDLASIAWSEKVNILATDFAVMVLDGSPTAMWWLTPNALSAVAVKKGQTLHDSPIHVGRFLQWMRSLKDPSKAVGIYAWSDKNSEANRQHLENILKASRRKK